MKSLSLYEQLIKAEKAEEIAKARRIEIEEKIYNSLKHQLLKTEGQETIEDHGYAITIMQPWSYKLDDEKYRALCNKLPEDMQFHRVELKIDMKKYSHVKNDKKFGKFISDCVTAKPGKVAVKVKIKGEN